jgi:hypothetical protein
MIVHQFAGENSGKPFHAVYVPDHGIISYFPGDRVDTFSSQPDGVGVARQWVEQKDEKYQGELDVPEDMVMSVVAKGITLNGVVDSTEHALAQPGVKPGEVESIGEGLKVCRQRFEESGNSLIQHLADVD